MQVLVKSDLNLEVWRDAPAEAQHLARNLLKNLSSSSPKCCGLAFGGQPLAQEATAAAD